MIPSPAYAPVEPIVFGTMAMFEVMNRSSAFRVDTIGMVLAVSPQRQVYATTLKVESVLRSDPPPLKSTNLALAQIGVALFPSKESHRHLVFDILRAIYDGDHSASGTNSVT